jgi:hypothetical protein
MTTLLHIPDFQYQAERRKHRFRCPTCSRIVEDGEVVMETRRRGHSTHAYHGACFTGMNATAAIARHNADPFNRSAWVQS